MSSQLQTIESLDLNLSQIFNDYYVVPSFQREYVWTTEQVEQLLQDIHDEYSDDGQKLEYFIGSLVVSPGKDDVLELIDGQQRMTTAYIFLCAVRDLLNEWGGKVTSLLEMQLASEGIDDDGRSIFRYRIDLQYDDSEEFLEKLARGEIDVNTVDAGTRSIANMVNAYQTIHTFLEQQFGSSNEELSKFYAYFVKRVKLVRIKTHSVAHALKVFETINDRGVGLDSMDLLKNLMFMQAKTEEFDLLKQDWKKLVDTLYDAREKPLRFLRYFIFANYNVDRLREDEIYRWFVDNEKECGYTRNPRSFVKKLSAAASAYTSFVRGNNRDGAYNRYLTNIRFLSGAARQHLILLMAGMELAKDDFTELSRQLENLFFAYIITREPTKEFERNFARWAPSLRNVKNRVDLNQFINTHIQPAKNNLALRYRQAFESLTQSGIQQYRLRYVLAKMTQYIDEAAFQAEKELINYINNKVDVEHILPQKPSPEAIASFDKPDEMPHYIQLFGNLTLLDKPIDSSIQNKPFSVKKNAYDHSSFLLTRSIATRVKIGGTTIDNVVKRLITFNEWTSESITRRQQMLTDLAFDVWEMPRGQAGMPAGS